jgi:hypothetical protein
MISDMNMNFTFNERKPVAAYAARRVRDLAVIYAAAGAVGLLIEAVRHAR